MGGSSPRLWGIRTGILHNYYYTRFIPTPVGHTMLFRQPLLLRPVHPHACGAYFFNTELIKLLDGSSPRLWGIRRAWATRTALFLGSSPRLWGILPHSRWMIAEWRFIPTPVGHTYAERHFSNLIRGSSPRLWGILSPPPLAHSKISGSSPRLWGIQLDLLIIVFN